MKEMTVKTNKQNQSDTNQKGMMILQACLEEHRALKKEIEQCNTSMRYYFIFNLTASGAIYSLVLNNINSFKYLLLIIPILSSLLGVIFFCHNLKIALIGHYIRDNISLKIKLLTNDNSVLDWENYIRKEDKKQKLFDWFSIELIWLTVFIIISGISLANSFVFGLDVSVIWIWIIGLVLTLVLLILMIIDRIFWLK